MRRRIAVFHGQKCSGPHVQGHLFERKPLRPHPLDQLRCEVQAGRRSGHGTFEFRIDGLVTGIVDLLTLAVQVRRDRNPAQMFQQLSERQISRPFEADDLLAAALALTPGQHPFRATFIFEIDHQRAVFPFFEVAHDAAPAARTFHGERPLVIRRIVRFEAEYLDPGPRRFVHDDPRPDHLGIVEHQQGPRRQYIADVAEAALRDFSPFVNKQLRCRTLLERILGDPLVGQVVVETVYVDMSFHFQHITGTKLTKIPVFTEKIPGLDQQINLALRSAFTIFISQNFDLDRRRLGNAQINLALRSAFTIFASDRRRFGQARTSSARRSLLLSLQKISL